MEKTVRAALLASGAVALLAGLDAALLLLGLPAPVTTDRLPDVHGGLLVLGFVGTLVSLERAVALRRPWGFAAPAGSGLGALLVLTTAPLGVGRAVVLAGYLVQLGVYRALWRRQPSPALALQALGAVLAAGAALLWWRDVPVPAVLPWFVGFLVLTILGERLELARVGALAAGQEERALLLGAGLVAAVVGATLWPTPGHVALGGVLLALVAWFLRHDVARRTVRATGLPRYMAWCLLLGYAWLAVAGAIWLLTGPVREGTGYDAVVHAVFLGFTLSMVMAHAPVILPAVLGVPVPYTRALAVPVALLHAGLALRLALGDLHGVVGAVQTGGVLGIVAVLGFLATAATSSVRAQAARRARTAARVPAAAEVGT